MHVKITINKAVQDAVDDDVHGVEGEVTEAADDVSVRRGQSGGGESETGMEWGLAALPRSKFGYPSSLPPVNLHFLSDLGLRSDIWAGLVGSRMTTRYLGFHFLYIFLWTGLAGGRALGAACRNSDLVNRVSKFRFVFIVVTLAACFSKVDHGC